MTVRPRVRLLALAVAALAATGCDGSPAAPHVLMDFARPTSLFDAPFPTDDLLASGMVDVSAIPNPRHAAAVEQVRALLAGRRGFATTGGVLFRVSAPLDPTSLPDLAGSVADDSPVFLLALDGASPDVGRRVPLEVTFDPDPGLYGAPNLLTLLPLQGVPLRAGERYAAVVTTDVRSVDGTHLAAAPPAALRTYPGATDALSALGVDPGTLAGLAVFTTEDPTAELATVRAAALARPLPAPDTAFARTDLFPDFCVYHATIPMPDWQSGTPPYSMEGGEWTFDASGAPVFQRTEEANLVVTVPRTAMPAAGYPLVVFVRTGGGGDRPLVDRGQQAMEGGPAIEPGEGPARYFARAGFAGLEVDGPLGGLRNTTGGDEQFLIFNVDNLGALRDNVRESAVELDVIAHVAAGLHLDASDCPPLAGGTGSRDVHFDADHFALMGHSTGATIAQPAVAFEPLYGALILSGAGGSFIENILYKQRPLAPLPVIALLLREPTVAHDDPMLTFAQWALEPGDPPVYDRWLVREPGADAAPRQVLMEQGIVDDYILPRIANAASLSIGLDLAGTELDTESDPRLDGQQPLGPLLSLVGRHTLSLPVSGNVNTESGPVTAVVVQHMEDGIEDGHEVVFQTDAPKHQYQCFLSSWLAGAASVPPDASRDAPCP